MAATIVNIWTHGKIQIDHNRDVAGTFFQLRLISSESKYAMTCPCSISVSHSYPTLLISAATAQPWATVLLPCLGNHV